MVTNGLTFSVADLQSLPFIGNHYHSNAAGALGNPLAKAEVGGFLFTSEQPEEVRGMSEFNLAGLSTSGVSRVRFSVFKENSLADEGRGVFDIDVYAYRGNQAENLSDFEIPTLGLVGSFNTGPLSVGDLLEFDVDSIVDSLILGGDTSLGLRLQQRTRGLDGKGFVFDQFQLMSAAPPPAGAPGPLPLLGAAAAFRFSRRLKSRMQAAGSRSSCGGRGQG
ncbi:MAG: hypothetical protein VKK62_06995 [Synechococcaceae cyanobacterium]|nr:hypothetical protein [Synechococcaceae cyanobacterium]